MRREDGLFEEKEMVVNSKTFLKKSFYKPIQNEPEKKVLQLNNT